MSASTATTCRRSATGVGACEFDLSIRCEMTDVEPALPILALNSGSSSLKFGLYRVGSALVEVLLTGEAESFDDKESKFIVRDSRNHVLLSETAPTPSQREAIVRIARLLTAVKAGKSIDTSMGLTPSGGVIMGTRSGDLDPGVLIYLMREEQFNAAMLEELIDRRSGLLGISGVDGDMRRLHEAASSNADARLAIQMFCYSVRKLVAAMIAALDGIDLIVFTGGIGENDEEVRAAICRSLSWIGVSLDEARNDSANNPINHPASRCAVLVLASQEDEHCAARRG